MVILVCASCQLALEITTFLATRGTCQMAVHGALAAFNPREEDWSEYSETLTFYFTANGITAASYPP